jgi:sacsin
MPSRAIVEHCTLRPRRANIIRLGVGGKRQGGKIGRHGVGFNAIYHLTDMPCILSKGKLVLLDPLLRLRYTEERGGTAAKPGLALKFSSPALDSFSAQTAPYKSILGMLGRASDVDLNHGTLFRSPFRSHSPRLPKAAEHISRLVVTPENEADLTAEFKRDSLLWLLFVGNIKEIRFSRIMPASDENPKDCKLQVVASVVRSRVPCDSGPQQSGAAQVTPLEQLRTAIKEKLGGASRAHNTSAPADMDVDIRCRNQYA